MGTALVVGKAQTSHQDATTALHEDTKMKTTKNLFALALIATTLTGSALAQTNVASQQVSVNVSEIAVIAVHGNINLTINTATAGQEPEPATAAATYDVSTNGSNKKISAQLDSNMPKDLKLFATMAAPNSATSTGRKELKDKSVDLVTGITKVRGSGLALTYEAEAKIEATPDNVTRTITYTLTNN